MTNFLTAGIIAEQLEDLLSRMNRMEKRFLEQGSIEYLQEISEIKNMTREVLDFLNRFSCQPLIYTGKGTTEEVINRLDWLLTFSDLGNAPPGGGTKKSSRKRKKARLPENDAQ
jgi:hypothetical protein